MRAARGTPLLVTSTAQPWAAESRCLGSRTLASFRKKSWKWLF